GLAQRREPRVAVALRESPAIGPDDQRHVREARRLQAEGPIQQQLPGGGGNQVVAANDFGHALCRVIDDHGKPIGGRSGGFPDDEIAADLPEVDGSGTAGAVVEFWRIDNAETPRGWPFERRGILDPAMRTSAGIGWAFVLGMGGAGGEFDVPAAAS